MSILKEFGEKVKVEKYMTEEFLKNAFKNAFSLMGEDSVTSIKVIKIKFTVNHSACSISTQSY